MFDMFKICYYIYKDIEIELRSLNRRTYWNYENGVMIELGIKFYKKKLRLTYNKNNFIVLQKGNWWIKMGVWRCWKVEQLQRGEGFKQRKFRIEENCVLEFKKRLKKWSLVERKQ